MVEALAKFGFVTSQLPIQISLEMHCSPPQQQKIAAYFREILGSMLLTPEDLVNEAGLTSPEQMSRRVMIKGKIAPLLAENDPRRLPRGHWTARLLDRLRKATGGKARGSSTPSAGPSRSVSDAFSSSREQLDAIDEEALEEVHLKAFASITYGANGRRGGVRTRRSLAELLQSGRVSRSSVGGRLSSRPPRRGSLNWLAGIEESSSWRVANRDPWAVQQAAVRLSLAQAGHTSPAGSSQLEGRRDGKTKSPKKKARNVDPDLAAVITMPGMGIEAFMQTDGARKMLCVTSISEAKLQHLGSDEIIAMQRRTIRSHGRAFPLGLRTDSSNMDPWIAWRGGLQVSRPRRRLSLSLDCAALPTSSPTCCPPGDT